MSELTPYLPEFFVFAIANTLTLISPGPDFMMIVRSSLRYSRKTALLVACGISCGELIHVTYSLLGLGVLISQSPFLFNILKYIGGAYLVYIGYSSLKAEKFAGAATQAPLSTEKESDLSPWQAFRSGVLTNALNAKAAFFTVSFFSVLVSPSTPLVIQILYGFFIQISTLIWFSLVAIFLTNPILQSRLLGIKHWIERSCGAILIALGFKLAFGQIAF